MTKVSGFYIQIEDSLGNVLGSGPITDADSFEATLRVDGAGSFSFSMPATVDKANLIQNERIARAAAFFNGSWHEVGYGPISDTQRTYGDNGVSLSISGDDIFRELTYRSVHQLEIAASNSYVDHATAVAALSPFWPPGWTMYPDGAPGNNQLYARFGGETLLAATIAIAQKSQSHFYRASGKSVQFQSTFTPSGIRAMQGNSTGTLAPETCIITSLSKRTQSYDLFTRIYPRGSGNADVKLTLFATNRSAPPGYTLLPNLNSLENNAATTAYGLREREVDFKDIGPIDNTDADFQAASNALFDAAYRELQRAADMVNTATYEIELAQCSALLRPMQSIDVLYLDEAAGLDVQATLNILEATWAIQDDEIQTTRIVVSTSDKWLGSDVDTLADVVTQGTVYQAHPQIVGNSYWENGTVYVGDNQTTMMGEMPFVFGPEVTQLQKVVVRYKQVECLSFVNFYVGQATTTPSGGGVTSDITHAAVMNHGHFIQVQRDVVNTGSPLYWHTSKGLNYNGGSIGIESPTTGIVTLSDLSAHQHDVPNHTHSFTPLLALPTYGLFRTPTANTYALNELELSCNGSTFVGLETGTATGDGYYELDVTPQCQRSTNFRPINTNNLIQIRRKTSATTPKTAQVYIKLGIRSTIQSISYS